MTFLQNIWGLALLWTCVGGLIIPEELPSILSVIYSNIPPIKKGTDSRVGVGFRLGEHADFQVLLELGPQTETAPIGPNADSKRRRQAPKPTAYVQTETSHVADNVSNTPGGKWLSSWRSSLINTAPVKPQFLGHQKIQGTLQNEYIVSHLSQLYKNIETTTETSTLKTFTSVPNTSSTNAPQEENVMVTNTPPHNMTINKEEASAEN